MENGDYRNTDLYKLETYANEAFGGNIQYYFSDISAKNFAVFIGNKKSEEDKNKLSTGLNMRKKGIDGTLDAPEKVSYEDLKKLYYHVEYFKAEFLSFEAFLITLKKLAAEMVKVKSARTTALARTASTATSAMGIREAENEEIKKRSFFSVPLNTNISALRYTPSKPDLEWTLKHLVKDANDQLYWRFETPVKLEDGSEGDTVYPLIVKSDKLSSYIAPDKVFWDHFWEEESERVEGYLTAVLNFLVAFHHGLADLPEWDSIKDQFPAFEMGIRSICPTALLKCLHIGFQCETVKGHTYIKDVGIKLRAPDSGTPVESFERDNMQPKLAITLVQGIPMSKLQRIRVFDDVAGTAVHTLPKRPLGIEIPTKHPDLLEYGCPTWDMFLHSTDSEGHTKFPSQRMGELRLAKAVVGIINKDDYSRQILACFGSGENGKTLCFDAISKIIGSSCALTGMSFSDFGRQFGLQDAINKRMLVVDDVENAYNFFTAEMIKRISGAMAGIILVDRKFDSKFRWSPSGCKIIMSTNRPCKLSDEATVSRCLPLTFLKNYSVSKQADGADLTLRLAEEGKEFLRWCYAVCLYYNNVKNANGEICPLFKGAHCDFAKDQGEYSFIGKGLLVRTDEQFDRWLAGELDLLPEDEFERNTIREEAFTKETTLPHRADPMIILKSDSAEEAEVTVYLDRICDQLFEVDETAVLSCADMGLNLIDFITIKEGEIGPEIRPLYNLLRACGFTEYKTFDKLKNSRLYQNFRQTIVSKFGINSKPILRNKKVFKGFNGLKMKTLEDFLGGQPTTQTPTNDEGLF